jgi:predicted O-linked N-acetylglucosamine transferase (SPINDLY family)
LRASNKPHQLLDGAFLISKLNNAIILHKSGKIDEAEKIYKELLKINKKNSDVNHLYGVICIQKKKYQSAINYIEEACKINDSANYRLNLGNAYRLIGNDDSAVKMYRLAIELNEKCYEAYYNIALINMEKNEEIALDCFKKSIDIKYDYFEAYNNLGVIYKKKFDLEKAILLFSKSLEYNNKNCDALRNLGNIFAIKNDFNRAAACYLKVIELEPLDYKAYFNYAIMLNKINKYQDSIDYSLKALSLNNKSNKMLGNIASNLNSLKKYKEASFYYNKINLLQEGEENLVGEKMINEKNMSDFIYFEKDKILIKQLIKENKAPISLFALLSIDDDESVQYQLATNLCNKIKVENNIKERVKNKIVKKNKYKIGYFSSDIRSHPVAFLMADVFKLHNKEQFEIILINNSEIKDEFYQSLIIYFDSEVNIARLYHKDAIEIVHKIDLDVAIDLNGHTKGSRTSLFLEGVAPIQINYLGYAGTMGSKEYDYIFSDINAIPIINHINYSEKVINLDFFMANPKSRKYNSIKLSKKEIGLNEDMFIFACLNNIDKFTPNILIAWSRILLATKSQLLILESNKDSMKNLKKFFEQFNCDDKIVFFPKSTYDKYMTSYNLIDLFLDTEYLNAGTTATDALSVGALVLTKKGKSYASRYCAAILQELNMEELITESTEEYIDKAINICNDKTLFFKLKDGLKKYKDECKVFKSSDFILNYEKNILKLIEMEIENGKKYFN